MPKTRLKTAVAGTLTALGLLTAGFVGGWEGKRNTAYWDSIGKVWTVCYGETRNIRKGMHFTNEQCAEMLGDGLVEFEAGIRPCFKDPDAIPDKAYAASLSLAWNIGQGAFCRSTVIRRFNDGNYRGACDAFLAWNKAGGRIVKGLVNRRNAERALCLDGISNAR